MTTSVNFMSRKFVNYSRRMVRKRCWIRWDLNRTVRIVGRDLHAGRVTLCLTATCVEYVTRKLSMFQIGEFSVWSPVSNHRLYSSEIYGPTIDIIYGRTCSDCLPTVAYLKLVINILFWHFQIAVFINTCLQIMMCWVVLVVTITSGLCVMITCRLMGNLNTCTVL